MSKLAEALRSIRVFNNYGILERFGTSEDVAIEYRRTALGRLGWSSSDHTAVWSPYRNPKLTPVHMSRVFERRFNGIRRESWTPALMWAMEQFGHDYVPSPFGGYIPKHVKEKAIEATRLKG